MGIKDCIALVGRISDADASDIVARVDSMIARGMSPDDASRAALQDMLREIAQERREIMSALTPTLPMRLSQPIEEEEDNAPSGLFYSALMDHVRAAKANAGTPEYWKGWINQAVNKGQIKKDELNLSGILPWLDEQIKPTKEQIMRHIGEQLPQLDMVSSVKIDMPSYAEVADEIYENDVFEWNGFRISREFPEDYIVSAPDRSMAAMPTIGRAYEWIRKKLGARETYYDQYRVPGDASNYTESLLVLADKLPAGYKLKPLEQLGYMLTAPDGVEYLYRTEQDAIQDAARRQSPGYTHRHWKNMRNVVGHMRTDERIAKDGGRVFFVHELQSDWGQDRRDALQGVKEGRLTEAQAEQNAPKAPWIDSTDKWVGLLLRTAIKKAADGGFDYMAIATGNQNVALYDFLWRRVRSVTWEPVGETRGVLTARKMSGEVFFQQEIERSEVPDYIGQDNARKLFEDGTLTDIRFGGKGMRVFYDSIVPIALEREAKRLGAEVAQVPITHLAQRFFVQSRSAGGTWDIMEQFEGETVPYDTVRSRERAQEIADRLNKEFGSESVEHVGIKITPELRKRMSKGVPLFSQAISAPSDVKDSKLDNFIYQWQDRMIDLKRVTQVSGQLSDRANGYLREELYYGRSAARIKYFLDDEWAPLLKEMRLANVSMRELGEYLHARHAKERNMAMKAINQNRPNNDALSGMSDADAARILANARPVMARLASRVDGILEGTRNLLEVSGLETPATIQALRNAYQHYVPLFREEQDDESFAIGQGYSVRGSTIKRATGSESAVDHENLLARIAEAREQAIVRAEKNLVGLAIYNMALRNPDPQFWEADVPPPEAYRNVVDERIQIYNPGTQQMVPNPNYGQVRRVLNPMYKSLDNVLVVRLNGEDRFVTFNSENERALRLAKSLKNLDGLDFGPVMRATQFTTRWFSAVNTQYNPVFMFTNMIRDLQGATLNLTSTPINGAQLEILNPERLAGIMRALYLDARSGERANNQWADVVREFRMRGGATGYRDLYENIHERARKLGSVGQENQAQALLNVISAANDAVENVIRVSAYKAARDRGMSADKAASLAKNLTVNFNRKGAKLGQTTSALYAFFNAAVQGNARMLETLIHGKSGPVIVGSLFLAGVAQALIYAGLDDDDREAVPEYTKLTSRFFPTGDGKYVSIPMPLGFNAIPNLGRVFTEVILESMAGDKVQVNERIFEVLSIIAEAANPISMGSDPLQLILPTIADPIAQLYSNKSTFGSPIYRERDENRPGAPGYTIGRDSTAQAYKSLAYGIHMLFHQDPYARNIDLPAWTSPQPEALRFIPETVLGGVWRETEKLVEMLEASIDGKEVPTNRTILLSRFAGDLRTTDSPKNQYYRNIDEVLAEYERVRRAAANGETVDSRLADLNSYVGNTRRRMRELIEARRELALSDAPESEIKAIEQEMADLMRELNAEVRRARQKN